MTEQQAYVASNVLIGILLLAFIASVLYLVNQP